MKKENCYTTLLQAAKATENKIEDGQLLNDGANNWDIFNLIEHIKREEYLNKNELDGEENYYCIGINGEIGITHDNGYNVDWIFTIADKSGETI